MPFKEHEFRLKKEKGKPNVGMRSPPDDPTDDMDRAKEYLEESEAQPEERHKRLSEGRA